MDNQTSNQQQLINNLHPTLKKQETWDMVAQGLKKLVEEQSIPLDEASKLEEIVGGLVLGATSPEEGEQEIYDQIYLPKEKRDAIIRGINEKILNPLIVLIKKDEGESATAQEKPQPIKTAQQSSKLTERVRETPQDVSVNLEEGEGSSGYTDTDPYREPIE